MSAPTPAKATPAKEEPKLVVYTGDAGTREISRSDWKAAGIEHDAVVWNADNDYALPASSFSAEALELLKRDRFIKVR